MKCAQLHTLLFNNNDTQLQLTLSGRQVDRPLRTVGLELPAFCLEILSLNARKQPLGKNGVRIATMIRKQQMSAAAILKLNIPYNLERIKLSYSRAVHSVNAKQRVLSMNRVNKAPYLETSPSR